MNSGKIYNYIDNNKLNIELAMNDYIGYVYTVVKNYSFNLSDEDIEEIVLDTFYTLWNNQSKLDINKNMSSYIAGIARNLVKKKFHSVKLNENIEDYEEKIADIRNIELSFIEREKGNIVNEELSKLKRQDKDIFIMYYYDENSIKEIAKYYDVSESKVKSKLFRIRKRLDKVLKKRGYISNEKQ